MLSYVDIRTTAFIATRIEEDAAGGGAYVTRIEQRKPVARRGSRFRRFDRLPIHSGCSLITHNVQQRLGQIGLGRHIFEQPTGVGHAGGGASRLLGPRFVQQEAPPLGCVRGLGRPAPRGAVGEHGAQLRHYVANATAIPGCCRS